MLLKVMQFSVVALFSSVLGVAVAHAQWSDDDGGSKARGSSGYPREEIFRPIQIYPSMIEASVELAFPSGPGSSGQGLFNWVGLRLRGDYGVTDEIQAGLEIPLAIVSPSSSIPGLSGEFFGGIVAHGYYRVMDEFSAKARLGLGVAGLFSSNGYFPAYQFFGDLKFGLGLGAVYKKRLTDEIALVAAPEFNFQAGDQSTITLHLPVAGYYQVTPEVAVGLHTGIFTGDEFSFDADNGLTLPFMLSGMYTLMDGQLDVGGSLGFGSLVTPGMVGVGETFFIGFNAAWRSE